MSVAAVLYPLAALVVSAADKTPEDKDVKAGGTAALVFIGLMLAVVVLAFSLVKQLRKAQAAKDAGVYGDDEEPADDTPAEPENHSTP
jgi:hypothetical protein